HRGVPRVEVDGAAGEVAVDGCRRRFGRRRRGGRGGAPLARRPPRGAGRVAALRGGGACRRAHLGVVADGFADVADGASGHQHRDGRDDEGKTGTAGKGVHVHQIRGATRTPAVTGGFPTNTGGGFGTARVIVQHSCDVKTGTPYPWRDLRGPAATG